MIFWNFANLVVRVLLTIFFAGFVLSQPVLASEEDEAPIVPVAEALLEPVSYEIYLSAPRPQKPILDSLLEASREEERIAKAGSPFSFALCLPSILLSNDSTMPWCPSVSTSMTRKSAKGWELSWRPIRKICPSDKSRSSLPNPCVLTRSIFLNPSPSTLGISSTWPKERPNWGIPLVPSLVPMILRAEQTGEGVVRVVRLPKLRKPNLTPKRKLQSTKSLNFV